MGAAQMMYRTGGIILLYVTGGTTSHVLGGLCRLSGGHALGRRRFQIDGWHEYTVRNSEFRCTMHPHHSPEGEGSTLRATTGISRCGHS
ncbi:hypothetical protein ACFV2N_44480 [Streptomyces sp. NPDC059680]|uniref:hypothetical protein n=1 Tax=Streptomyces sp. NPDC059680 TaxID=3346904 RepID=UPI0036AEE4F8